MYNHLRGTVVNVVPGKIIIDTHGIGWEVLAPLSTTGKIRSGQECTVLTHLIVREDAMILYGFLTEEERALFRRLIALSGVGAATAAQILSSVSPNDFLLAIEKQDAGFLKKIKGIGEKTAKRIILELKGAKMLMPAADGAPALDGTAGDAVMALMTLGVSEKEAAARVEKALQKDPGMTLDALVTAALQG